MRLAHITEDFVASGGGLPAVVSAHLMWQKELDWEVSLLQTSTANLLDYSDSKLITCPPVINSDNNWKWSPRLSGVVKQLIADGNQIFHLHGFWTAPQAVASKLTFRSRIPNILSFHGQLLKPAMGKALSVHGLKKRLYLNLIGQKIVSRSRVLHAITRQEADILNQMFPSSRIEIIPNYINVHHVDESLKQIDNPKSSGNKEILFIGRLDKRKGVDLLVKAFIQAQLHEDWSLCIAGPDDIPGVREHLVSLARESGMAERIRILGPVYGEDKWRLFKEARLVCLPSFHEVIGMVNLEAAICGKPVLTTPNTGLEGWEESGGIMVQPSCEPLSNALKKIALWSDSEFDERGTSLRNWVSDHYGLERIRSHWIELYERILQ